MAQERGNYLQGTCSQHHHWLYYTYLRMKCAIKIHCNAILGIHVMQVQNLTVIIHMYIAPDIQCYLIDLIDQAVGPEAEDSES